MKKYAITYTTDPTDWNTVDTVLVEMRGARTTADDVECYLIDILKAYGVDEDAAEHIAYAHDYYIRNVEDTDVDYSLGTPGAIPKPTSGRQAK